MRVDMSPLRRLRGQPTSATASPRPPAARDLAQLEALFHAHYAPLCDYVWHVVRSRDLAEDIVQSLFVRLWELQGGDTSPDLGVAYLYTAARNRAIGHLRRDRVARRFAAELQALPAPAPPAASDEVHARELQHAAERAVAALPPRCQEVFRMSRQHGLGYADIAATLGVSRATVETQMSRALRALRAALAPFLTGR